MSRSKRRFGDDLSRCQDSMCEGPEVECLRISESVGLNPNEGGTAGGIHTGILAFPGWPAGR